MISEFLDRDYVLKETLAQRKWLAAVRKKIRQKDKETLAQLKKYRITPAQISRAIAALDDALARAKRDKKHPQGTAYIPPDPVTNSLQRGLTDIAIKEEKVERNAPAAPSEPQTPVRRSALRRGLRTAAPGMDTSPPLRLRRSVPAAGKRRALRPTRVPFIEGNPLEGGDPLYGLDGFKAKFGALFEKRRDFNRRPARVASSAKPLTLFLFGDWGTGLDLAAEVTKRIGEQLAAEDGTRQPHVIHLGDVYYVGDADEYTERMLPFWPVSSAQSKAVGSWSLNGNHDMYSGGEGYFDTLLREDIMSRWHGDERGEPSSFFLIEDADWQIFGLDTSWNLPSLGSTIFGKPTLKDYGGQNGVLTKEQVTWMASQRNPEKGCILLTHHQPASSRKGDSQHADQAVAMLKAAGVYGQIDAWVWGHEHRGVVFRPKAERTTKRLKDAPNFCACLGHAGVPVTAANFDAANRIADVLWEEDRLDASAPIYEGMRVVPFGFARIDTKPGAFEFRAYDHAGQERHISLVHREVTAAPTRSTRRPRAARAQPKERLTRRRAHK